MLLSSKESKLKIYKCTTENNLKLTQYNMTANIAMKIIEPIIGTAITYQGMLFAGAIVVNKRKVIIFYILKQELVLIIC